MQYCWKSHVTAQLVVFMFQIKMHLNSYNTSKQDSTRKNRLAALVRCKWNCFSIYSYLFACCIYIEDRTWVLIFYWIYKKSWGKVFKCEACDFAKAFDKVLHWRLLHKLDYYGIRGSTHKCIMAVWPHSTSSIRWSSLWSSPCVIRCTPRISFRTDPVPYFYKRSAR